MPEGWEWDESLYRGSAPFYVRGRPPYAPGLAAALASRIPLDGRSRVLDVGCGPGVLTLPLAPFAAEAVGVDPDPGMLAEAARRADAMGIGNARWVRARAEDLPGDLGRFRLATFGQSFHWMDRPRVAATVLGMLEPGGALVLVADVKTPPAVRPPLPHPEPPYAAIRDLVREWLGPVPRAGQGLLRHGTPGDEEDVLAAAGYAGPERLALPPEGPRILTEDDLVAWVWSLSGSAPHLFGDRRDAFAGELRRLLRDAAPDGTFAEWPPDTDVRIWRTPERGSRPDPGSAPPATWPHRASAGRSRRSRPGQARPSVAILQRRKAKIGLGGRYTSLVVGGRPDGPERRRRRASCGRPSRLGSIRCASWSRW